MAELSFRLLDIILTSKAIAPRPDDGRVGNMISFEINADSKVNQEKKLYVQFVQTNIFDTPDRILATFNIACVFEIDNFDEFIKLNENGFYDVHKDVELYFKSASISTLRGIIWSELRGTYLGHAIMPVIDVSTLKPKNVQQQQAQ